MLGNFTEDYSELDDFPPLLLEILEKEFGICKPAEYDFVEPLYQVISKGLLWLFFYVATWWEEYWGDSKTLESLPYKEISNNFNILVKYLQKYGCH